MGVITTKCCNYDRKYEDHFKLDNLNNSKKNKLSKLIIIKVFDRSNNNISDQSENDNINIKRKVNFYHLVEQRIFNYEEDKEYNKIIYKTNVKQLQISKIEDEEMITNISFEYSENRFVIEDCFYKISYDLPKTIDQLVDEINKTPDNSDCLKENIELVIQSVLENNNRIDALIMINNNKRLVILTEILIQIFLLDNTNKFLVENTYSINEIDYITLSRDGKKIIIHLINDKIICIEHDKLDRLAACIASSHLYDINGTLITKNFTPRQISVILLNENFELFEQINNISNFIEYR